MTRSHRLLICLSTLMAVVVVAPLIAVRPAHAANGDLFDYAQDCVQAGGTLVGPQPPSPVGSPTCSDSLSGHSGRLYSWVGAGVGTWIGIGVPYGVGGGVGGWDIIGQHLTATQTGTLIATPRISGVLPPDTALPVAGVAVTTMFTCAEIINLTTSQGGGSCWSARFSFGGMPRNASVAVTAGDSVRVQTDIFLGAVDGVGVCFIDQCLAAAAGPKAVTAQLDGFSLEYSR